MIGPEGLEPSSEVVVVGAGLAGIRSAEALRRAGFAGPLTLVGDEASVPYDRPPLSKQVLAGRWELERVALTDDDKLAELSIDLRVGAGAVALDLDAGAVHLEGGQELKADAVVVASGCRARWLPGTEGMAGVHVLRRGADALALREALSARASQSIVVIGSGFIGAEVASEAASRGHEVTVLEAEATPLARILPREVAETIGGLHATAGVALRCGVQVAGLREVPGGVIVDLAGGEELAADLVVVGIGVVPNTSWLEGSGLEIDNGLVVDEKLFAHDAVVGVGDVARFTWARHGLADAVRIEHWTVANDHASHAGAALLAGRASAPALELVPYFWSDQYQTKIQVLGRPGPADEVHVVEGSLEEHRAVVVLGQGDRLTGVLGLSRPRHLMAFRPLVESGASVAEALALELG